MKAKFRNQPAGMFCEIMAASREKVPDPHMGSSSGSLPSYPEIARMAAAVVSLNGAVALWIFMPRL